MIIDHGQLLYDGPLSTLKERLLRVKQIKFALRDSDAATGLARTLEAEGLAFDRIDEMNYRVRFDRTQVSTAELIRKVLAGAEVRDLLIEDEPIEDIIKRIYAGEAGLETPVGAERVS
jgi:ABC-2 type transport system ATP-binding protein